MVLRQLLETEKIAPGKSTLESVHLARQAVQLDVEDGTSWCEFLDIRMYDLLGAQTVIRVCVCLQLSWEMPTCPCSLPVARNQSFLNKP